MVTRRPAEETARLGDEIYERDIRAQVEADHHGEYVAIDVNTGCWAIAGELRDAAKRLRAEQPDAIDVWLLRVGHRALHHFGGRPLRRAECSKASSMPPGRRWSPLLFEAPRDER